MQIIYYYTYRTFPCHDRKLSISPRHTPWSNVGLRALLKAQQLCRSYHGHTKDRTTDLAGPSQVAKKITKTLAPCRYTPIWHNPDFKLHKTPVYFPSWQQRGLTHLHHLFENNEFVSFNALIHPKYRVGRD